MPTQEEALKLIFAAVREAERRILPAKLVDPCQDGANGHKIAGYIREHKLDATLADSHYQAIQALAASLQWQIKPGNLQSAERNTTQSAEETLRLFDEYERGGYAPPDLILDGDNAKTMLDFVIDKYGIVSITYLKEAERVLGNRLKRLRQPTKREIEAELGKRAETKMRQDYLESIKPQRTLEQQRLADSKLDANRQAAEEREHKSLLSQIESEISNHSVGHPSGAMDYSRTQSERDTLSSVRDRHDLSTTNGTRTALSAVRATRARF